MAYLNEDGLARYDGLIKQWVTFKSGTVDGIDPLLNWQKTTTAGAVTFYPLPAAPIDPVVNFAFTETGPASGTKSPDNPSTITGVTQAKVTRCGKNLIGFPYQYESQTINGVTFTVFADGSVLVDGTATGSAVFRLSQGSTKNPILLKHGVLYTLSGCPAGGSIDTYKIYLGGYDSAFTAIADRGSSASVTPTKDSYSNLYIQVSNGTTVSNLVFKPQLELGSAATSFEPYDGADYTIDLGGTFYGGSVDLSAGTMAVTHVMVEPDSLSYDISAHPANAGSFQYADTFGRTVTTDGNTLTITGETGGQIVYNLATPETVSLSLLQIYSLSQPNPYTPRLNTVYSDQTSVEVGYPKSPQASQTELTNAIVSLGGNV